MSCLAVIAIIAAAQHHTADPLAQAGPGLVPGAVGQHPAGCLNKGLRLGVNYPSNIILGPSYIGPPSQAGASAGVTEEQRLIQMQTVNKRALQCAGEEAAGARLEVESVSCTLVTVRNPSQAFLCSPSFLKLVCCLVKVKEGIRKGKVEVMMVLEVATALCWWVVVIITSKTRKDDCDVSTNGSQYGSTCE